MKGVVKRIESISVATLQRMNTFESSGSFGRQCKALDDLVIDHLMLTRELETMNAYEELCCRMMVEGFSQIEIAEELGISLRSVHRLVGQLRWTVYGFSPLDAQHRPN